jgi:hypothetical protein
LSNADDDDDDDITSRCKDRVSDSYTKGPGFNSLHEDGLYSTRGTNSGIKRCIKAYALLSAF